MTTAVILIPILSGLAVITNGQFVNNCDGSQKMAEENFNRFIFYGDRGAYFPSSDSDVTKYCQMVEDNVSNYTKFLKCLKPFPKQIFGMVAKGFQKYTETRCTTPNWRLQFANFGNCVKRVHLEEELHGCIDKATVMYEYIDQHVKKGHKISMTCCVTQVMSNCFRTKSRACGNELSEFPFLMVNEPISKVFNLMCRSMNSLPKCVAKHPKYMKDIRQLIISGVKPKGSFFNSQLQVANGLNI